MLNSQKYTCVGVSFFNKVASELWQNFMSNFFIEHLRRLLLKMKDFAHFNFLSFKIYNKGNWFLVNYFFKLKMYEMAKTTLILGNSSFHYFSNSFLNFAGNEYCSKLQKEFRFQVIYTPNISYFSEFPLDIWI